MSRISNEYLDSDKKAGDSMRLSQVTLDHLGYLILEGTDYRRGYDLVVFFNELGFDDEYGQGFPSRGFYTSNKLNEINDTPLMEQAIKNLLNPQKFIGKTAQLDEIIKDLNARLAFDDLEVVRNDAQITIQPRTPGPIVVEPGAPQEEIDYLHRDFAEVNISELGLGPVTAVLEQRVEEIKACITSGSAPLSAVILCGSVLEGVLLGVALSDPAKFVAAGIAPKDRKTGAVLPIPEWNLAGHIDVAKELGYIDTDTQRYSHVLRDFRNYVHPNKQLTTGFAPTMHTARISWQVLKAAILQVKDTINPPTPPAP